MEDILVPAMLFGTLFIGLPWLIFHYVTQWRRNAGLTMQDEKLLDELHDLARRLDDRLATIERIVAVDDPGFRRPDTERLADERSDTHIFDRLGERQRRR